jgi:soluble lytic murein transglycosylase
LLQSYPLYPYLDYYLLGNNFHRTNPGAVAEFVAQWPGLPVNARLRSDWLRALARQRRWDLYLAEWSDTPDTTLQCHWVTANINTGKGDDAAVVSMAESLWLSGRSQPDACDTVFAWLEDSGRLTPGLVQDRILLALEARQFGLAGWLARRLDASDRDFVARWQAMQRSPARELVAQSLRADSARERQLVLAGLDRLVRLDPEHGRAALARLQSRFEFNESDRVALLRTAAVRAAQRHEPQAGEWLAEIAGSDAVADEWRVRAALRSQDWPTALVALDALPQPLQEQSTWQYWRARVESETGNDDAARVRFERLAMDTGYHAWLAADRINRAYNIGNAAVTADEAVIESLAAMPGVQRAREFLALGMPAEARAEWQSATTGLDDDHLVQAAVLAQRWNWHTQAIATVNRARRFEHLDLRYPVIYAQQILPAATERNLDPALVYSLVRSESMFAADARSGAGALGLMQLLPGTGREVARRFGIRLTNSSGLYDPDTNIRLGSAYLGTVLDRFNRHEVLATAAYNAGPSRVSRWLPRDSALPADIWVETIPYDETRTYVHRVMGGTAIFDWRMGREVRQMSARMIDIPATAE